MDREDLKGMRNNPNFIPGIPNYCDRWCERCTHTSKCMVYAMEQKSFDDPETKDVNNKKFWDEIISSLQAATELLEEAAEDLNLDFDNMELPNIKNPDKKAKNYPLSKLSKRYSKKVNEWFKKATPELESLGIQIEKKAEMGFSEEELITEADHLNDLLEIVRWYQHQIHIKIMRALHGQLDGIETDPVQNDANGSAKVAFIGISRSTAAWAELYNEFPTFEDEILSMLALLEKLRSSLKKSFPNLLKFERPGFDK